MKRLIFLPLMLLCFSVFSQGVIVNDSITFPTGSDTTIYVRMYSVDNWSISFDYSALDGTNDTLDLGGVNVTDGSAFGRLDDIRLPFIMTGSTKPFEKTNFSFIYLAIRFAPGTSTEGTTTYTLIKR